MKTFNLPDLGEGLQEAEIVSWHVNPGDRVVADQPLVSVETDKAVVEVPSPYAGQIAELFGAEGDLVKVGAPLVAFAEAAQADSGTVVGQIAAGEEVAEEVTSGERGGRTRDRAGDAGGARAGAAQGRRSGAGRGLGRGRHDHRGRRRARGDDALRGRPARAAARRPPGHGLAHGACPRRGRAGHGQRRRRCRRLARRATSRCGWSAPSSPAAPASRR